MNGQSDDLDYTDSELITLKDYYKRNREISIMLFSLTYILNIIDASVNAHLSEYEINEDNFKPFIRIKFNKKKGEIVFNKIHTKKHEIPKIFILIN